MARKSQNAEPEELVVEIPKKRLPAVRKAATAVDRPVDWKAKLAAYAAKTVKMEEATQTGNRISTRGGRLSYHGTPMDEIHGVVMAALIENVYYDGKFDADQPRAPICFAFSTDGEDMAPHEKAHEPQHETCSGCPHDEWGSADTGRGKACKNVRRLAILSMTDPNVANAQNGEIAMLNIPVTSVAGYSAYVKQLALNSGMGPQAWHTRIWCEPDQKNQYRVCFASLDKKPLPDKVCEALANRIPEAEKMLDQPYVYIEPAEPTPKKAQRNKFAKKR